MQEIFIIIKTNEGYNITLKDNKTKYFNKDIKTLKELFKQMSKLTNC